jgi:2-dehydro-3-deoxyphosphogluconate aldolase/(4S)-4-hydroxy-2-oxoglutarate aldolase
MSLLDLAPVVPVVVVNDAETAVPLARALVSGGLPVIEITLRTAAALESIRRIAAEVPDAVVGAGTVRSAADVDAAVEAGSRFLVSPGTTPGLLDALLASGVPFLPCAATATEAMTLFERGVHEMKFFPAEAAGGVPYLKSLGGPLPDVRFCPTGGITLSSAPSYLALSNVGCVGGSWLTPADVLAAGDYDRIEKLAAEAAALRS